jgi:hypothetical protein
VILIKVGFAVTIMLALSVFLTIISESIPNNSVSVSLLGVYLLIMQVISMLILMFTVKNMQLYHRPKHIPVPHAHRRLVLLANKLRCQGGERSMARVAPVTTETKHQNKDDHNQEMASPHQEEAAEPDIVVTWAEVTEALDFLFLLIFSAFAVITTVIISVLMIKQPPLTETAQAVVDEYVYDDE